MDSIGPLGFIIYAAVIILILAGWWMVFTKAKKPGWAFLIPIYNIIVLLEIVGKPWWWLLLLLIPIVNIVIMIMMLNLLSKSFGYGVGFTLGLIFLGIVFIPILGFGEAKYKGPAGK